MSIELKIQKNIKMSYNTDDELVDKLNKLSLAVGDLKIEQCTPETIDTKTMVCCILL